MYVTNAGGCSHGPLVPDLSHALHPPRPPLPCPRSFLPGRCSVEVPPQHVPPLLLLQAPEVLLQGEQAAVTVTVAVGVHAVQDAVLVATAVHLDSQQQLGLAAVAAPLGAPPQQAQPSAGGGGEGCSVALGELPAGQRQQVVLLLDARFSGAVEVIAELKASACVFAAGVCPTCSWPCLLHAPLCDMSSAPISSTRLFVSVHACHPLPPFPNQTF